MNASPNSDAGTAKIVGLVLARNEAPLLPFCLRALALFTDAICLLDDASEDNTIEVVESLKDECTIERLIRKTTWEHANERANRQHLLEGGREIGGTHFVIVDADEAVSSNLLVSDHLRHQVLALQAGDCLAMPLIHLWRSVHQYRVDPSKWVGRMIRFAFADDTKCRYDGSRLHMERVPPRLEGKVLGIKGHAFGLLHFQFVDWENVLVKQAWYRCMERIMVPGKSAQAINVPYAPSKDEAGLLLQPAPVAWLEGYPFFDEAVFYQPDPWRRQQVLRWFAEHGRAHFADLDIWDIDWDGQGTPPEAVPFPPTAAFRHRLLGCLNLLRIQGEQHEIIEELRLLRRHFADYLLTLPERESRKAFQEPQGDVIRALMESPLRTMPLTKEETTFAKALAEGLNTLSAQGRQPLPSAVQAVSLYLPPGNVKKRPTPHSTQQPFLPPRSLSHPATISLLAPTRGRPDGALRLALNMTETATMPGRVELLFYVDENDPQQQTYADRFRQHEARFKDLLQLRLIVGEPMGLMRSWNELARQAKGDLLIMAADDQTYDTPGWDTRLDEEVKRFPDEIFCMWFNEGHWGRKLCTFPIVSRRWCRTLGYFVPPFFERIYADTWIQDIAQRLGRLHYIPDVLTEHHHVSYGKGTLDDTYALQFNPDGSVKPAIRRDMDLFARTTSYRIADAHRLAAVMDHVPTLRAGMPVQGRPSIFGDPIATVPKVLTSASIQQQHTHGWMAVRNRLDDIAARITTPTPLIVDGGANKGALIDLYLQHYQRPRILAFEPNPELAEALEQKYRHEPGVTVYQQALGAEPRTASFHIANDEDTSSILPPSAIGLHYHGDKVRLKRTIEVPQVRLGDVVHEEIDLLKLDLQGYELEALMGCAELLKRIRIIDIEVEFVPLYDEQPLFSDVEHFLRAHGFYLLNLYELYTHPDAQLAAGNALFLNFRYYPPTAAEPTDRRSAPLDA